MMNKVQLKWKKSSLNGKSPSGPNPNAISSVSDQKDFNFFNRLIFSKIHSLHS